MTDAMLTIARALFAYLLLLVVSRAVGRKAISQMTFFDFAVAITFGSVTANLGMGSQNTPLNASLVLVTFGSLAILTAFIAMKSMRVRKLIASEPVVLIAKGEIVKENLQKIRLSIGTLNSLLREKNAFNIMDVEYAILENDGKISVLLKSNKQPLTPFDMNIATPYKGLLHEIILDGRLMRENLAKAGKDEPWLSDQLSAKGIRNIKDVFYAALDVSGELYLTLGISGIEDHGKYGIE